LDITSSYIKNYFSSKHMPNAWDLLYNKQQFAYLKKKC
jgi:hypothetical protein